MRAEYNSNNLKETTRWQPEFQSEATLCSSYDSHFIIHFSWNLLYTGFLEMPSSITTTGNQSVKTEREGNNRKTRLMHNIKHTNSKI